MAWSLRMLHAAFSDRRWEIHQVIAEGDTVVLNCTFHGRHTGEFMGLAPTSRSFAFRQVHIVRFQDGMGIEHWASLTTWTWPASSARSLARPANPLCGCLGPAAVGLAPVTCCPRWDGRVSRAELVKIPPRCTPSGDAQLPAGP
jgi:SnoaL-like polyketide cyclase